MSAFPVHLDLAGRDCLVVGAGPVGVRKAAGLVEAGAIVTVVAPEVSPGIASLGGSVVVERREVRLPDDVRGRWLVLTATGTDVDADVARACEAERVWVNSADDPPNCAFTLAAVLRRGPVTVSVGTGGSSPALAGWLRDRVGEVIGPEAGEGAALLAEARSRLQARGVSTEGLGWRDTLDAGLLDLLSEGRVDDARRMLDGFVERALAGTGGL